MWSVHVLRNLEIVLHILEIVLHILRILRLRSNLKIVHYSCAISRLCTIVAQSRDCATFVRNIQIAQITHAHCSWYRRWLDNCSTKGRKTTVTETICVSASERFSYLACHPTMNQIAGEQHGSTTLRHFIRSNFPHARREAHDMQKSVYLVA